MLRDLVCRIILNRVVHDDVGGRMLLHEIKHFRESQRFINLESGEFEVVAQPG